MISLWYTCREAPVQKHLKQVYTCLTMSTLAAAAGAYIHLFTNILSGNFLTSFAAIGFMLTLFATPDESGKNAKTRIGLLLGFSFCTGITLLIMLFFCLFQRKNNWFVLSIHVLLQVLVLDRCWIQLSVLIQQSSQLLSCQLLWSSHAFLFVLWCPLVANICSLEGLFSPCFLFWVSCSWQTSSLDQLWSFK